MTKWGVFQGDKDFSRDILVGIFLIDHDAEVFLKNSDIEKGYIKEVDMCPSEWCKVGDQAE